MNSYRWILMVLACWVIAFCSVSALAQAVDRAQVEKEIDSLWEQIKGKQEILLDTSDEDKVACAEFLKQPETGLIRLLPRERYDYAHKLPMRGGGAYYSFALRTHEYGRGSDIGLEQGKFSVGFGGYDFGFIVMFNDLPLEEMTLEHPLIRSLVEYQPPLKENEIRAEHRRTYQGIKVGELTAKSSAPLNTSVSYVLRSFDFDNTDVLVAFRIVRQDQDGSVILIWKMLKKFPAPKSIRESQN